MYKVFVSILAPLLFSTASHACMMHDAPASPSAAYDASMERMHQGMMIAYTGDPDTDFAAGMIPHHQGAVDMAEIELKYGKDPAIRELAGFIKYNQELEIARMRHWLDTRGNVFRNPNSPAVPLWKDSMDRMHHAMMIQYTGNADVDFARGMIPHHQGAVDMAEIELKYGRDPMLRQLSWDIIRSQGQEIRLMQRWLGTQNTTPTTEMKEHDHGHASH